MPISFLDYCANNVCFFSYIFRSFAELGDDTLELCIIRGINYGLPSGMNSLSMITETLLYTCILLLWPAQYPVIVF